MWWRLGRVVHQNGQQSEEYFDTPTRDDYFNNFTASKRKKVFEQIFIMMSQWFQSNRHIFSLFIQRLALVIINRHQTGTIIIKSV